jgi:hypothetical protein
MAEPIKLVESGIIKDAIHGAIFVKSEDAVEKTKTWAEAQSLFEHFVINEERVTVWVAYPGYINSEEEANVFVGKPIWTYDPDIMRA